MALSASLPLSPEACSEPGNVVDIRNGCKINLYLRILEKLPSGYHTLDSLFLPLPEPCDHLHIRLCPDGPPGCIQTRFEDAHEPGVPLSIIDPASNTLTKAYDWYAKRTGFAPSVGVLVRKGVPQGAGLGGGSANAAALLLWMHEKAAASGYTVPAWDVFIRDAASVGADVPFFLLGRPALARGIGEQLTPVANPVSGMHLVLVCPKVSVSTAWAYTALDTYRAQYSNLINKNTLFPASEKKVQKTGGEILTSAGSHAIYSSPHGALPGNDFEEVVFARYPELDNMRQKLLKQGADIARMSGSGSTIFALFREKKNALNAASGLAKKGLSVYTQTMRPDEDIHSRARETRE